MELSSQNLQLLFTGYNMIFQKAFDGVESEYEKIASIVPSSSKQTVYPFRKRTLQLREFTDSRHIQNLEVASYTLTNKHFEGTVGIDIDDISDDQFGVYNDDMAELGEAVKAWPDQLIFGMMNAATGGSAVTVGDNYSVPVPIGYDGVSFFSASHPVGKAGATANASNLNSSGSGPYWYLINGARAIKPFVWQNREPFKLVNMRAVTDEQVFDKKMLRVGVDGRANAGVAFWQLAYASNTDLSNPANYGAAISAMRGIKDDAGRPFRSWSGDPGKKYLVVPRSLEEVARQLLHSEFGAIAGASGAVAGVPGSNTWKNSATLIVSDYLTA